MNLYLNNLKSMEKALSYFLYALYKARRMSGSSFSHSFIAVLPLSLVSNATNFFIHYLKRFVLEKSCLRVADFFNRVPFSFLLYANIPLKYLETGLLTKPF